MRFKKTHGLAFFIVVLDHAEGSRSRRAVAEHDLEGSPRMRARNLDVAGVAWSNFEPGVDVNGSFSILNDVAAIDVVDVCDSVNVAAVKLIGCEGGVKGVRGKRLQASASMHSPHACRAHHSVQGCRVELPQRRQPVTNPVTAHRCAS